MALITCSECGNTVSDKAQACPHCGCPITITTNNTMVVHQPQKPEDISNTIYKNRDALLLYLRDLRDLLLAEEYIHRQKEHDLQGINTKITEASNMIDRSSCNYKVTINDVQIRYNLPPNFGLMLFNSPWIGFAIFIMGVATKTILAIIIGIIVGAAPFTLFKVLQKQLVKERRISYLSRVATNEEQDKKLEVLKKQKEEIVKIWDEREKAIVPYIRRAFDINIIPDVDNHRSLSFVYYIHKYMASSKVSFEYALRSREIHEEFEKTRGQLDTIIRQNDYIICQNRRQESQNNTIIKQNKELMESNNRIESNTEEAAMYSKIAANYAAVNTFFSAATYFNTKH